MSMRTGVWVGQVISSARAGDHAKKARAPINNTTTTTWYISVFMGIHLLRWPGTTENQYTIWVTSPAASTTTSEAALRSLIASAFQRSSPSSAGGDRFVAKTAPPTIHPLRSAARGELKLRHV